MFPISGILDFSWINHQAIGGMLGTAGGAGGTGFDNPALAPISSPVTPGQVNAGQEGAQNALGRGDALVSSLNQQNGLGNQSTTFNQNQGLINALAGANGVGTQNAATGQQAGLNSLLAALNGAGSAGAAMGGQGALAGNLAAANGVGAQAAGIGGLLNVLGQQQGIANGTGPNPAMAMLNQTTGQNVANQAALMAGQRGAGANVGLLARQAGQQGAGIEQQAAGQAATMQAQQQLNALNAMGNTAQGIAGIGAGLTAQQQAALSGLYGQGAGTLGQLQTGIGQQFGQGSTNIGQLQAGLGQGAGIAQNQVGNLAGAVGANVQGNLGNSGQLLGAAGNYNTAQVGSQGSLNAANAGNAQAQMGNTGKLIGGALSAMGPATVLATAPAAAAALAEGGPVSRPQANGPASAFGQFLLNRGSPMAAGGLANGGGNVAASSPDQKAVKGGNSYANDKVPALLSEGEMVLPRTVMEAADPVKAAAEFVTAHMAKRGKK